MDIFLCGLCMCHTLSNADLIFFRLLSNSARRFPIAINKHIEITQIINYSNAVRALVRAVPELFVERQSNVIELRVHLRRS